MVGAGVGGVGAGVGDSVGRAVGCNVGCGVGDAVGCGVGLLVGAAVGGGVVGVGVGSGVGAAVGGAVGFAVGAAVGGGVVGCMVGWLVGCGVGGPVGFEVGKGVVGAGVGGVGSGVGELVGGGVVGAGVGGRGVGGGKVGAAVGTGVLSGQLPEPDETVRDTVHCVPTAGSDTSGPMVTSSNAAPQQYNPCSPLQATWYFDRKMMRKYTSRTQSSQPSMARADEVPDGRRRPIDAERQGALPVKPAASTDLLTYGQVCLSGGEFEQVPVCRTSIASMPKVGIHAVSPHPC
mmetsp:Transcript_11096/g.35219  ORF Transcript_11096/g.35219 Transcript_11096/m.35219 type:complete len:290 (-) Transcript_11096:472-1341(-)